MLGDALGEAGPSRQPSLGFVAAVLGVVLLRGRFRVFWWQALDADRHEPMSCGHARRDVDACRVGWADQHRRRFVRAFIHAQDGAIFAVSHQIEVFDGLGAARDDHRARALGEIDERCHAVARDARLDGDDRALALGQEPTASARRARRLAEGARIGGGARGRRRMRAGAEQERGEQAAASADHGSRAPMAARPVSQIAAIQAKFVPCASICTVARRAPCAQNASAVPSLSRALRASSPAA